jgi:hypothetical protein
MISQSTKTGTRNYITTEISFFAEWLKHSSKPEKHSPQALPSVALGK